MWSFFHIIFLISPFIFTAILFFFTKNKSEKTKRKIGIILSIICIVILLLRNIEIYVKSNSIQPEIIPFQICHFANFVLLLAYLMKNKTLFSVAFCFNLPFAFLSIIFANSLENYSTIINFRGFAYIFGHMLIVVITLWSLLVGFININKKTIKNAIIFIFSLFFISVPINNLFNKIMPNYEANYFYTHLPEEGTPLELAFNWGKNVEVMGMTVNFVYLLVTALFGIAIFFAFYGLYKIFDKKITKII
jgi:uncharacterized membrane protein YwaF